MKTTKAHFEIFKAECEKWVKIWGLLDWEVFYYHQKLTGDTAARCTTNSSNRIASLFLSTEWDESEVTNHIIRRRAFHEVSELFLARLFSLACDRFVDEESLDEASHAIIRRLENVVFERMKNADIYNGSYPNSGSITEYPTLKVNKKIE